VLFVNTSGTSGASVKAEVKASGLADAPFVIQTTNLA
jgi:hypothetical protein